jgi:hypothetical protein
MSGLHLKFKKGVNFKEMFDQLRISDLIDYIAIGMDKNIKLDQDLSLEDDLKSNVLFLKGWTLDTELQSEFNERRLPHKKVIFLGKDGIFIPFDLQKYTDQDFDISLHKLCLKIKPNPINSWAIEYIYVNETLIYYDSKERHQDAKTEELFLNRSYEYYDSKVDQNNKASFEINSERSMNGFIIRFPDDNFVDKLVNLKIKLNGHIYMDLNGSEIYYSSIINNNFRIVDNCVIYYLENVLKKNSFQYRMNIKNIDSVIFEVTFNDPCYKNKKIEIALSVHNFIERNKPPSHENDVFIFYGIQKYTFFKPYNFNKCTLAKQIPDRIVKLTGPKKNGSNSSNHPIELNSTIEENTSKESGKAKKYHMII